MGRITAVVMGLTLTLISGCKVTVSEGFDDEHDRDSFSSGFFLYIGDTGEDFPDDSWSLDVAAEACIDDSLYFETDSGRVRVYGSPAYSETDFRAAATELERRIDGVLSRFQLRWPEFVEDRSTSVPDPDHLIGCLSPTLSRSEFASASVAAVSIMPYASQWPYDSDRIITHELAHFVQENLSRYQARHSLLPLWFAEGQASVVAGEPIAPVYQHYDYDPLMDVTVFDATTADYRFEHYALAYHYLEEANGPLALTVLLDLVQFADWEGLDGTTASGESLAFVEAFNAAGLVDHRNRYLSLERFKTEYHELLRNSY
ncbi:hypothetical protein MD273_13350 [Marinobacter pelagius]|uniref:hypothetical protein n=1 Tax=Marinobacter sp. C7 TaxID=2951363 RepID=UPI001EF10C1C|nr:hypothetical protein [Marinobacter sp. C7]MCG7200715.1 hypothetical protein [Marinobacter sp. C7]